MFKIKLCTKSVFFVGAIIILFNDRRLLTKNSCDKASEYMINVGINLRRQELTSLGSNKHIKVAAADATTDIMVVMDGL